MNLYIIESGNSKQAAYMPMLYAIKTMARAAAAELIIGFTEQTADYWVKDDDYVEIRCLPVYMNNVVKGHRANTILNMQQITNIVCDIMTFPVSSVFVKRRFRKTVEVRQMAMYVAKMHTGLSLKDIGNYFGGFDHTSVLHACKSMQNLIDTERDFFEHYVSIKQRLDELLNSHTQIH